MATTSIQMDGTFTPTSTSDVSNSSSHLSQDNVLSVAQPILQQEKAENHCNEQLVAESLKDNNKEITQKIMEIVIKKIPHSKGNQHYNLTHLLKDVDSLVFPSDSEKTLSPKQKTMTASQANRKMEDVCAALGEKIGIAAPNLIPHLDEIKKSINDWDIVDATSKTSKDKKLLQDVQELIQKINDVHGKFVAWKGEIKQYLETSRTSLAAPEAYSLILQNYNTQYINISRLSIIPFDGQKQSFIKRLEKRIKEASNATPSEEVYTTIAATHEISVKTLKKNLADFHDRTKNCKELKQKLEENSSKQTLEIERFKKYYNYLDYCVKNRCYYGKKVIVNFELGYSVGFYNYIDQQRVKINKKVSASNVEEDEQTTIKDIILSDDTTADQNSHSSNDLASTPGTQSSGMNIEQVEEEFIRKPKMSASQRRSVPIPIPTHIMPLSPPPRHDSQPQNTIPNILLASTPNRNSGNSSKDNSESNEESDSTA